MEEDYGEICYHWMEGDSLAPPCQAEPDIIQKILEIAQILPEDVLFDLGCGDGRIPIKASKEFGIKSVGVDIEEREIAKFRNILILESEIVQSLVTPILGDLEVQSLEGATILIMYLLPEAFPKIQHKLVDFLRSGGNKRIICNTWGPSQEVLTPISTTVCGLYNNVSLFLYDNSSIVNRNVELAAADSLKISQQKQSNDMKRKLPRSWSTPKYSYLSFPGQIILISTVETCDRVCLEISTNYTLIGLDIEWWVTFQHNEALRPASLLQICGSEQICYIFQLTVLKTFPESLVRIICDENIKKVGSNILGDESKIYRDYKSHFGDSVCRGFEDLSVTFKRHKSASNSFLSSSSLAHLSERFLQKCLNKDKRIRLSNWETEALTADQISYAATDAYASWKIYLAIVSQTTEDSPTVAPEANPKQEEQTLSAKKRRSPKPIKMKKVSVSPKSKSDADSKSDETILSDLTINHSSPPSSPKRQERSVATCLLSPSMELDSKERDIRIDRPAVVQGCPMHALSSKVVNLLNSLDGVVFETEKSKATQMPAAIRSVYRMFYVEKLTIAAISFERKTQVSTTYNYLLEVIDFGAEYDSVQFELSPGVRNGIVWSILQTERSLDGVVHVKAKAVLERLRLAVSCEGCQASVSGVTLAEPTYWQIFFVMKHLTRRLGDDWFHQLEL